MDERDSNDASTGAVRTAVETSTAANASAASSGTSTSDPHPLPVPEAEQLRLLVENARDYAMFLVAEDGVIHTWNPGVRNLLGYEEEEWIGGSCSRIFTPEDQAQGAPEQERTTAAREGRAEDERWHVRKDGTRFWGSGVMTAIYDDSGRLISLGKVLRDHTEKKRLEEELEARVAERTAQLKEALAALEQSLQEQQGLVGRLVTAQEEERRRISRELHDEMGQLLTGFGLQLKALETAVTHLSPPGSGAKQTLERLRVLSRDMAHEVHRIAVELRPTSLDDLGLVPALEAYVEEWSQHTRITAEFTAVGLPTDRLAPLIETTIYRVVQEALNNAAKYAVPHGATQVSVTLQRMDGHAQATIEDNGPGFDVTVALRSGRLGLIGMRERAELLQGTLQIESEPGEGTTIYLRVPVVQENDRIDSIGSGSSG